jgi:hypothetical protein
VNFLAFGTLARLGAAWNNLYTGFLGRSEQASTAFNPT